jgi:hypothetical protein
MNAYGSAQSYQRGVSIRAYFYGATVAAAEKAVAVWLLGYPPIPFMLNGVNSPLKSSVRVLRV